MIGPMIELVLSLPNWFLGDPVADTEWHQASRGYQEEMSRSDKRGFAQGYVEAYE